MSKRTELADALRSRIVNGEWEPGDRLPSEREICAEYGESSRTTVRGALADLIAEGLVGSAQGKGYFVLDPAMIELNLPLIETSNSNRVDWWVHDIERQNHRARQVITGVEIVRPAPRISAALGLGEGEYAVVRRRLRYVDDAPHALADSYFPEALVRGTPIASPEDIPTGGRHVLADLGWPLERHRDEIQTRRLTADEATRLRMPQGMPTLVWTRESGPKDGRIVRVMVTTMPAERVRIVVDLSGLESRD